MRKVRLFVLVLTAALAAALAVAAAASASPKLAGGPATLEGEGGEATFAGTNQIKCSANLAKGSVAAGGQEGELALAFTGCATEVEGKSVSCKTEGGLPGEVKWLDIWKPSLWDSEREMFGWVILAGEAIAKCGLVHVKMLAVVQAATTLVSGVKTLSTSLKAAGKSGKQEPANCEEPLALCSEGPFQPMIEWGEAKLEDQVVTFSDSIHFSKELVAEG